MRVEIFYDPAWPNPGSMLVAAIDLPFLPPLGASIAMPDGSTKVIRAMCIYPVAPPGEAFSAGDPLHGCPMQCPAALRRSQC